MKMKEQYKKETGKYSFDLQNRPTKDYVEWLEKKCEKKESELRFINTSEKEPELGGYYFCNVWLEDNTYPSRAILEWKEKKNAADGTYYDWDISPTEREGFTKIEWLHGLTVHN